MVDNAIKLAIEQRGGAVDGWTINYTTQDDSTADAGKWTPEKELDNATRAVADPSLIAYIGTMNSGAAKISIPILCKAGIAMISPAASYPGLTKPGGGAAGEPDIYYTGCKTGTKDFFRVTPADDIQGKAGADWAKALGTSKVFIIDDTEIYGKGIADVFEANAKTDGLTVLGHVQALGTSTDYKALAAKIKAAGPDLVYYGGITQNNAGQLWRDLREAMPDLKLMAPEGIGDEDWLKAAGTAAEGTYLTFPGAPAAQYTGKAAKFRDDFMAKYNVTSLDPYTIYGYEVANVVLDSMDKAIKDGASDVATIRSATLKAIAATKDYNGVLGTWSFDANGDISLSAFSGMQVVSGQFTFVKVLGT